MRRITAAMLSLLLVASMSFNVSAASIESGSNPDNTADASVTGKYVSDISNAYITTVNQNNTGTLSDGTQITVTGNSELSADIRMVVTVITSGDTDAYSYVNSKFDKISGNPYALSISFYKGDTKITLDKNVTVAVKVPTGYSNAEFYTLKSDSLTKVKDNVNAADTVSSDINSDIIYVVAHNHSYGADWSSDAANHWHECTCGDKSDLAAHTAGDWVVDQEATTSEEGSKHKACTVCGRILETATIPKAEEGTVTEEVKTDGKAPDVQMSNSASELKEMVLTTEEKARVEAGEDAKIYLEVKDVSDSVSKEDKALVKSKLGDYSVGLYLDISLFKQIGNDNPQKIANTSGKITVSIKIPTNLINSDSTKTRTYKIVRVHEGVASIIEGTYDAKTGYFTFETDQFSTYALIYNDVNKDSGNGSGGTTGTTSTTDTTNTTLAAKTGDTTNVMLWAMLMAGTVVLLGGVILMKKRAR